MTGSWIRSEGDASIRSPSALRDDQPAGAAAPLRGVLRQPLVGAEDIGALHADLRRLRDTSLRCLLGCQHSHGGASRLLAQAPNGVSHPHHCYHLAFGISAFSVAAATLRNLDNATPTLGIPHGGLLRRLLRAALCYD
ncbi:MAG: hypothetical protein MZV64_16815 [Ignavibacteriales bacterium]|nr:hypothetical protein [Ignavibacteriales bacterium]